MIKPRSLGAMPRFLLSRLALKALGVSLDFERDSLRVFKQAVPLKTNSAGQYVVHLIDSPSDTVVAASFNEVMAKVDSPESNTVPAVDDVFYEDPCPESNTTPPVIQQEIATTLEPGVLPSSLMIWTQDNSDVVSTPLLSQSGPKWKQVIRRKIIKRSANKVLNDMNIYLGTPQHKTINALHGRRTHIRTVFTYLPMRENPKKEYDLEARPWTAHQNRRLKS